MRRGPYSPHEKIFSRTAGYQVAWVGVFIGFLALAVGTWYFYTGQDTWQTMIFTTLAFSQVWQALAARSAQSSFSISIFSNPLLIGMVVLAFVLQVAVIYMPALGKVFQTVPLTITDFVVSLVLSSMVFTGMELEKWLRRRTR
jgi:Ca2+-transporting ATPase